MSGHRRVICPESRASNRQTAPVTRAPVVSQQPQTKPCRLGVSRRPPATHSSAPRNMTFHVYPSFGRNPGIRHFLGTRPSTWQQSAVYYRSTLCQALAVGGSGGKREHSHYPRTARSLGGRTRRFT